MVQIVKTARGGITSEHGESVGRSSPHIGIDIGHGNSTDGDLLMVAPADGVVTAAGWSGTYGNRVIITHSDGTWSLIAHMASLAVAKGDTVEQRQKIGVMGRTGGPWGSIAGWFVHGHQEYHLADGRAANPLDFIGTTPAGETATPLPKPKPAPPLTEEDTMLYLATTTSSDGLIQKGWRYKQTGTGPFCAVSNLETIALQAAKIFTASYDGNDIRLLAALYGFAEHEKLTPGNVSSNKIPLNGPGRLTGRVIYSDNAHPELPIVRIAA